MYSLQSIAKPSLVYTLLHWKPLSLTPKAILVFSPLKPKIGGRCQVSSYLLVTVSFFLSSRKWGLLLGLCTYHRMFPQKGNLTKGFSPNHTSVCMQSGYHGEKVFGRRASISSLQRLLQFCNKLYPLFFLENDVKFIKQ